MKQDCYLRVEALCATLVAEQRELRREDQTRLVAADGGEALGFEALLSIYSSVSAAARRSVSL